MHDQLMYHRTNVPRPGDSEPVRFLRRRAINLREVTEQFFGRNQIIVARRGRQYNGSVQEREQSSSNRLHDLNLMQILVANLLNANRKIGRGALVATVDSFP